jgi:CHAD domain-containing protein
MHGVEFAVLLHRALEARVQELNDASAGENGFSDPEVVHRVRVACRRLRTVMGLLDEEAYPHLDGRAKALRDFTKGLGAVRDLDVQLAGLGDLHACADQPIQQAAVEHLLELVARRRGKRLKTLDTKVPNLAKLLKVPSLPSPFEGPSVTFDAWSCLQPCITAALSRISGLRGREDIKDLHVSRIQVKRLRDAMEALAPAFPAEPTGFLMELRAMQTALGDHHDQAALESLLRKNLDHLRSAARPALAASLLEVLESVANSRQQAFERFCALDGPWDDIEFSARVQALLGVNAA